MSFLSTPWYGNCGCRKPQEGASCLGSPFWVVGAARGDRSGRAWGGTMCISSFSFSHPMNPSQGEPHPELPVTVLLRGTVAEPGALGSVHGTASMSWRGLRPLDRFHEAPGLSWH